MHYLGEAKVIVFICTDINVCRTTHDVKATDIGGRSVRFKAEVDFDGREITRYYLEQQDLEKMLQVNSVLTTGVLCLTYS